MQHDDSYDEDAHADEDDDGHGGHAVESPRWVLVPLLVGLVLGIIALVILGIDPDVAPFAR